MHMYSTCILISVNINCTDREADRWTDGQTGSQTGRQTGVSKDRRTDRQVQAVGWAHIQPNA